MRLHGYFRSSAAWRVRITLGLKGLAVEHVFHHLRKGEQSAPQYRALNPQCLVPTLEAGDGSVLTQSLAIIEWLDETYPDPPLLPGDRLTRARARAFAQSIACDIHPVQNLRVLNKVRGLGCDDAQVTAWAADVNRVGLAACEALQVGASTRFCYGNQPSIADICLVPQLGNARRFKVDVTQFPRLLAVERACMDLDAFRDAVPDRQPDAE